MLSKTMYPGKVNSPRTETTAAIAADAVSITVLNGSVLPAAPNIAMLGIPGATDVETILYTVKTGNVISGITRGFQGTAKEWPSQTTVSRMFAEYDYDAIIQNIKDLNNSKQEGGQNLLINGNFDIWQRGTSQTATGYGSDDRWSNFNTVSTKTHSQQAFTVGQTDVPNNPIYFSRTIVVTGGTAGSYCGKEQRIEDVTKLSGKIVTFSFWAKADSNKSMSIESYQNFGSGGSAQVRGIGVQKLALTSAWQKFIVTVAIPSVFGKTIGASSYTSFAFWFDAGSTYSGWASSLGNQSGTFDLSQVQLCVGDAAMPFVHRSIGEELALCLRYYERTDYINSYIGALNTLGVSTSLALGFRFMVAKRVAPTIVIYNRDGTANKMANLLTGAAIGANCVCNYISTQNVQSIYDSSAPFTVGTPYEFGYTADAEL